MRLSFQEMTEYLLSSGDTQSSIARQLKVNPSTIHRVSRGLLNPRDRLAKGLINLYHKRVKYLKAVGLESDNTAEVENDDL